MFFFFYLKKYRQKISQKWNGGKTFRGNFFFFFFFIANGVSVWKGWCSIVLFLLGNEKKRCENYRDKDKGCGNWYEKFRGLKSRSGPMVIKSGEWDNILVVSKTSPFFHPLPPPSHPPKTPNPHHPFRVLHMYTFPPYIPHIPHIPARGVLFSFPGNGSRSRNH